MTRGAFSRNVLEGASQEHLDKISLFQVEIALPQRSAPFQVSFNHDYEG